MREGLGWFSGWGCWRTWLWWVRRHLTASARSDPWWPPLLPPSYQSGWSPHLGSRLRGQKIRNKHGPLLLYRVFFFYLNTHNTKISNDASYVLIETSDVFLLHSSKGNVWWSKEDGHISIRIIMVTVRSIHSKQKATHPKQHIPSSCNCHTHADIWAVSLETFFDCHLTATFRDVLPGRSFIGVNVPCVRLAAWTCVFVCVRRLLSINGCYPWF